MNDQLRELLPVYASVVATLAFCVSVVNAWWSIHVGRRDRADIRVSLATSYVNLGDGMIGPLLQPQAVNRGRRPVVITGYAFECRNGLQLAALPYAIGPLPKRLDEGQADSNYMSLRALQEAARRDPPGSEVRAFVFRAADGRQFRMPVRGGLWKLLHTSPLVDNPGDLSLLNLFRELPTQ
jgi:hypothetical protein